MDELDEVAAGFAELAWAALDSARSVAEQSWGAAHSRGAQQSSEPDAKAAFETAAAAAGAPRTTCRWARGRLGGVEPPDRVACPQWAEAQLWAAKCDSECGSLSNGLDRLNTALPHVPYDSLLLQERAAVES